jgi:hypothetical protein
MQLPKDFREFIELMIAANVRFVMIGGFAYNLYRNPRATGDIDFFVSADNANQIRLRDALTKFGFGKTLPPTDQNLIEDNQVLMHVPIHKNQFLHVRVNLDLLLVLP